MQEYDFPGENDLSPEESKLTYEFNAYPRHQPGSGREERRGSLFLAEEGEGGGP